MIVILYALSCVGAHVFSESVIANCLYPPVVIDTLEEDEAPRKNNCVSFVMYSSDSDSAPFISPFSRGMNTTLKAP